MVKLRRSLFSRPAGACRRYLVNRWPEWIGLLLLLFPLGVAINSIQRAEWIDPQPSLLTVLLLSMFLAFFLVKIRWSKTDTISAAVAVGLGVTIWQAAGIVTASSEGGILTRMAERLSSLWETMSATSPDEGTIYFALFLIILTWVIGFVSTWRYMKKRSVWPAVFLGLVALLVNLDYLNKNAYGQFFLYLLAAILPVSYSRFLKHHFSFQNYNARYPLRGVTWFLALVLGFSVVLIGGVWAVPEIRANQLQEVADARAEVGKALDSLRLNLFAPVKAKGSIIKSEDQNSLHFSSPPDLSHDVQFHILSPRAPSYWRVRRYDIYHPWGWSISPVEETIIEKGSSQTAVFSRADVSQLTYTVINELRTDIVLTAGQFLSSDSTVLAHLFPGNENLEAFSGDEIIYLKMPRVYKPDEGYTVTANLVSPTPSQLSAAGSLYPQWVTDRYLELPADLPESVRRLAQNATRRLTTTYDKVIAVKNYLTRFTYFEGGSFPPAGADAVEDFLTVQKTGNCTNFATAAVVMLRSAGIPARFCTGYVPHTWDRDNGVFIVEARDYHAWPEVYFPGYGWVEFEVTPGISPEPIAPQISQESSIDTSNNSDYFYIFGEGNVLPEPQSSPAGTAADRGWIKPMIIAIISLLLVAAVMELALRYWHKHFRREDYATAIYARLYFLASLMRMSPGFYQTPLEFGDYLSREFPRQKEAISGITRAYAASRFGGIREIDINKKEELRRYWRGLFRAFLKRRVLMMK